MTYPNETITTNLRPLPELGACALVQDLLPLYLEGEVSPGSRDLITEHLAGCDRCAGFLAGAQTVRAQLRRDGLQRAETLRQDAPRRGAVLRLRDILASVTAMILCLPGGAAAAAVGFGLRSGQDELFVGLIVASMVTGALLGLARVLGPLTNARLSAIFGGIALGGAGVILMFTLGESSGVMVLAGFAVGVAGLVGVWSGVARDGRVPLLHPA
jgi:predicted anti-sigma-YlaC factor YlaD